MQSDIEQEAQRILEAAEKKGIILRLLGGLAIKFSSPSANHRALTRRYPDIDFAGYRKQSRAIKELFTELGYEPNKRFNALHGDKRLMFYDTENQRQIDIFLDIFEMCHKFDFRGRLTLAETTLPIADLLITKLQVVEINEKDIKDIFCIIKDHELGSGEKASEPSIINVDHIVDLCSKDWGLYKTITININKILLFIDEYDFDPAEKAVIRGRLRKLLENIEKAPKSTRWKMRARVGEKVRWYDLPEEAVRVT